MHVAIQGGTSIVCNRLPSSSHCLTDYSGQNNSQKQCRQQPISTCGRSTRDRWLHARLCLRCRRLESDHRPGPPSDHERALLQTQVPALPAPANVIIQKRVTFAERPAKLRPGLYSAEMSNAPTTAQTVMSASSTVPATTICETVMSATATMIATTTAKETAFASTTRKPESLESVMPTWSQIFTRVEHLERTVARLEKEMAECCQKPIERGFKRGYAEMLWRTEAHREDMCTESRISGSVSCI